MLFSILLFALVLDFMLLPPVLLLFDKKKDQVIVQAEFNATSKEASDEIEIDVAAVPVEISEATPDGSKVTT